MVEQRYALLVRRAAIGAMIVAVTLILMKLYAWLVTHSNAMLATSTDSLLDLSASLVNFFMLKIALSPPDHDHKFGHGKAESLTGLAQSAFVLGSAILLVLHGIDATLSPTAIEQSNVAVVVSILSVIITSLLVAFQYYVVKHTQSTAIKADALHYQSDIAMNIGVLVSLLLSSSLYPEVDGIFTIAVGVWLMVGAAQIAKQSVDDLMDKELPQEQHNRILAIAKGVKMVKGVHDLRTRQSGGTAFIQLHLELDDQLPLINAHEIGDQVELRILDYLPHAEVLVHLDPLSVVSTKRDPITFRD